MRKIHKLVVDFLVVGSTSKLATLKECNCSGYMEEKKSDKVTIKVDIIRCKVLHNSVPY